MFFVSMMINWYSCLLFCALHCHCCSAVFCTSDKMCLLQHFFICYAVFV